VKPSGFPRVLVVDGNAKLAGVLAELVAEEHGLALAGCASTGAQALGLARSTPVDVVLVDERLDDALTTSVLEGLRQACPDAVVLLWCYDTVHTVAEGADGVLLRGMTFREVVCAIRAAVRAPRRVHAS
jgi:two-component system invasion response regulator UvrY